ncbi:hypothetical protein [Mycolicibacterium komossense]|uniref:Uncharacterized protein n=1 Tax=Mycolicibacterium komossense TaxID=1779 RepID=A0ABT3CHZ2_9MYCO|nr:hypothetical protein [Mycolicibacterium komossense]MCV7229088.1 hypothetical protein [Mycolicibacterium komossense]
MTIRDWIVTQLREQDDFSGKSKISNVEAIGAHGVKVERSGYPDAYAYCVEQGAGTPFSVEDLEAALEELPEAQMVIVTRRSVSPDVYSRSAELGLSVDTFGGFGRALQDFDNISQYVHPEEKYIRRRLAATRVVTSVDRVGHRAWLLTRNVGLRPLSIVTVDRYEMTDEQFGAVIDEYPELTPDALVVTNPSAQGFGERVVKSSKQVCIPLFKIDDFISDIRKPWN